MDVNEVWRALGDPEQEAVARAWAITACQDLRQVILTELANSNPVAEPPSATGKGGVTMTPHDVRENYVSETDFADIIRMRIFVEAEFKKLPPENPTDDEAVFWLARHELLHLVNRHAIAIELQIGAQRRLHNHGTGLCEGEVKNLFCEPGEDDFVLFAWSGVLMAWHHAMPHRDVHEQALKELARLFEWVAEIYYNLTEAVYATKLVGKCRRALMAFWRRIGTLDFAPYHEEFVKCRKSLDTAILTGEAGRFFDVNLCLASIAQSSIGINKGLIDLNAKVSPAGGVAPQVATAGPATRGPKGAHKNISIKYAAEVYGVSQATISNWDKSDGAVPSHYPGRDVSIDEFNNAAATDMMAMGKKEGVMSRISEAIRRRGATPSRPENNGAMPPHPENNGG